MKYICMVKGGLLWWWQPWLFGSYKFELFEAQRSIKFHVLLFSIRETDPPGQPRRTLFAAVCRVDCVKFPLWRVIVPELSFSNAVVCIPKETRNSSNSSYAASQMSGYRLTRRPMHWYLADGGSLLRVEVTLARWATAMSQFDVYSATETDGMPVWFASSVISNNYCLDWSKYKQASTMNHDWKDAQSIRWTTWTMYRTCRNQNPIRRSLSCHNKHRHSAHCFPFIET